MLLDSCHHLETCVDSSASPMTARQQAAKRGHTQVVAEIDEWIRQNETKKTRLTHVKTAEADLRTAARENNVSALQDLLKQNVNPFAQDDEGNTSLHLAAEKGHAGLVFHILSSQAGKKHPFWVIRNHRGRTAWDVADFCGHTEVSEEIYNHMTKRITSTQEQQAKLTSEVQRAVKKCQDECLRLQSALAEVQQKSEEYATIFDANKHILSVEDHRKLVQTALARDQDSSRTSGDIEQRFNSDSKLFVCGEFQDAANGHGELLQVDEGELLDKVRSGLEGMRQEVEKFGHEEVEELYDYVVNQAASVKVYVNGKRDEDNVGRRLAYFQEHPHTKEAKLTICEVAALRLYTLPVFKYINDPLRDQARVREGRAHPLAVMVEHLTRALKKLRRIDAGLTSATSSMISWRGMKNLTTTDEFSEKGGTELAPMSTTDNIETAVEYCMSENSLLFCIKSSNKLQVTCNF